MGRRAAVCSPGLVSKVKGGLGQHRGRNTVLPIPFFHIALLPINNNDIITSAARECLIKKINSAKLYKNTHAKKKTYT